MATARTKRRKAAVVAGVVTLLAASGMLINGGTPAGADVTALSGSAFGIRTTGILPIGPTPLVVGIGAPVAYGPLQDSTLGVSLPGPESCPSVPVTNVLQVCAIDVYTQGFTNANPHLNHADSQAAVAGVAVGPSGSTLSLTGVAATCRADGNDATGATTVVNSSINVPLVDGQIAPNTIIPVGNLLVVRLNEQVKVKVAGQNRIVVNAARISVLGVGGDSLLEATIGQVICDATGPDVNEVTTSSTSAPITTSSTVPCVGASCPTTSTTPPCTGPNCPTTTTPSTAPPCTGADCPTTSTTNPNFSSVTTIAGTTGGGSIVAGVLARTGAFLSNALVWAILVVFLGGIALLGSRGEVQTWPPKRSASRNHGPKRSGTSWPKNKPGSSKRRFF
ncbi:MAG TPA: choice-of-anchor P family protein [Acidimicrobiales bacterium]|nr:choice-of-anchor P family protein [Acidimicrobiales bacterium]